VAWNPLRPAATHYSVDEDIVAKFRDFLADNDGFKIW
jgi:hypothetical protein